MSNVPDKCSSTHREIGSVPLVLRPSQRNASERRGSHSPPAQSATSSVASDYAIEPVRVPVIIKGAGDLATGVAVRLYRAGFRIVMTELAKPLTVRRTVAFAQCVFDGRTSVEGIQAVCCSPQHIESCWQHAQIPVVVEPSLDTLGLPEPWVVVDATMAKENLGTRLRDGALVIALGPGFTAGVDCHAVVETNRGHYLGRVIWSGSAQPDTGRPGALPGVGSRVERVLRAPCAGHVIPAAHIGAKLYAGAQIGHVQPATGAPQPLIAPFSGILRGLIHSSVLVQKGWKIGDLDPRAIPEYCYTVSDKSFAVGGGVLEAIFLSLRRSTNPLA